MSLHMHITRPLFPTHTSCCFAAASMSLLYFKSSIGLVIAKQTRLPEKAVCSANTALQHMLDEVRGKESASSGHKYTKIFTAKDRQVGKYATETGITKAQRHLTELDLSESTALYFKKRYLSELAQHAKAGDSTVMQLDIAKH